MADLEDEDFETFKRRHEQASEVLRRGPRLPPKDLMPRRFEPEVEDVMRSAELRQIVREGGERTRLATRRENAATKPPVAAEDADRFWVSGVRMSRTEVSLRLALYLLRERIVKGDVQIALTGDEMTPKPRRPIFPVEEFLTKYGYTKTDGLEPDWRGTYTAGEADHAIVLGKKGHEAPMTSVLGGGMRLFVQVIGGPVNPTHSSTEHNQLSLAIGRVLVIDDVSPKDIVVVAMPRSRRFRTIVRQWREAPRVLKAGLRLVTVDRAGLVEGFTGLGVNKSRTESSHLRGEGEEV